MKLRNKRTGEIGELKPFVVDERIAVWVDNKSHPEYRYNSLAELNEEWEDAPEEEPKEYWYIDTSMMEVTYNSHGAESDVEEFNKEIGNYFETREEAEKAVEKLKAWHKLMDYWETEVLGWEIRDMPTGGNWQTVNVKFNVKTRKEPVELLDLLFGGEE